MLWLQLPLFLSFAVATSNWAEVMVETRGGAARNDLTWHKKNCGGGGGKKKERGGDILLSFLMSLTAIRLTSRLGRKENGRRRQDAVAGRIILTFPFLGTMRPGPHCHLQPQFTFHLLKFLVIVLLPKLFLKFFPQFWGVSDKCGGDVGRVGRRQKSLSFSFTPINYVDFLPPFFPSCASCKAPSAFVGPFELGSRPPSALLPFFLPFRASLVSRTPTRRVRPPLSASRGRG